MKQTRCILLAGLIIVLMNSCNALQPVKYANREWHISDYYGQIIDKDTTYRMTFGEVLIPEEMVIISCADSAAKYPGMENFIADILKTTGLQNDEVLFYSPVFGKMFVRLINEPVAKRPSELTAGMQSLTLNNENERPVSMGIWHDEIEDWHRKSGEMYTYAYFDKKKQRVLVVDYYDYGETPIAQIFVNQSRNRMTDKMHLPSQKQLWDFTRRKLKDYQRDILYWSYRVDSHRENAFENYKIGQEQLKKKK